MRWPWQKRTDEDARAALESAERALRAEHRRLDEVASVVERLRAHRERNSFAEAMRDAFGANS